MIHIIMIEGTIKIDTDQIVEIGKFNLVDKVEVDQGMNKIIGEESNRIRCYKCIDYDHFMKDCPISKEEREIDQIQ